MMNFIKRYQSLLGIVAILIAAFVIYSVFFAHPAPAPLSKISVATTQDPVDQQLIALLLTLHSITLDSSLFDNPKFTGLRDFGRDLVPEPVGRKNPFAPLTP
jgi:hypothetical protein